MELPETVLLCIICNRKARSCLIMPCAQLICCDQCVNGIRRASLNPQVNGEQNWQHNQFKCPICRERIQEVKRVDLPHYDLHVQQHLCMNCQFHTRKIVNGPCGHVCFCERCHLLDNTGQCQECGIDITETVSITIPSV